MKLLSNEKVIDIIEKTLNQIDGRLVNHGKRVAYLMFKVLAPQFRYNDKQLRDICLLAMLHDIGAYKTEEINRMVEFETVNINEHSVYGALFLKYFSPLSDLSPIILHHHSDCTAVMKLENDEHRTLAQLMSLCDRADVFSISGGTAEKFKSYLIANRDKKYLDYIVDMWVTSGINIDTVFNHIDHDKVFNRVFRHTPMTHEEVDGYIKMIIRSIDFRSSQTVIHTVAATCIAGKIAEFLEIVPFDVEKIMTAAVLHDIGKIGIPTTILESPDRLSPEDMEVMKKHVVLTAQIIDGTVDSETKQIAVNHHEKLDGSGYPNQIGITDIAHYDRIFAVADILSALCEVRSYKTALPKDQVIAILCSEVDRNHIDAKITALAIDRFDEITKAVALESEPVLKTYNDLYDEYYLLCAKNEADQATPDLDMAEPQLSFA